MDCRRRRYQVLTYLFSFTDFAMATTKTTKGKSAAPKGTSTSLLLLYFQSCPYTMLQARAPLPPTRPRPRKSPLSRAPTLTRSAKPATPSPSTAPRPSDFPVIPSTPGSQFPMRPGWISSGLSSRESLSLCENAHGFLTKRQLIGH